LDYYQGVVVEYLRADRTLFLNPEYCIQLDEGTAQGGRHWFCDTVVLDCRSKAMFLCEVTFAQRCPALLKRLKEWHDNWPAVVSAVTRLSKFEPAGGTWPLRPWIFIPQRDVDFVLTKLKAFSPETETLLFKPRITPLEMVQPWAYKWEREGEDLEQKKHIPPEYRT
jgi:hypothetical protein